MVLGKIRKYSCSFELGVQRESWVSLRLSCQQLQVMVSVTSVSSEKHLMFPKETLRLAGEIGRGGGSVGI